MKLFSDKFVIKLFKMIGNSKIDFEVNAEFISKQNELQKKIDKKFVIIDFLKENFFNYEHVFQPHLRNDYFTIPAHEGVFGASDLRYVIETSPENNKIIDLFKTTKKELNQLEMEMRKLNEEYQNWKNQ